ncbi:hypothetical protein DFH27DRAFT_601321 [Peziza echinospora]|nr:hypothetical protein DFH27DRAFT_601321 [Peziza echinospora]
MHLLPPLLLLLTTLATTALSTSLTFHLPPTDLLPRLTPHTTLTLTRAGHPTLSTPITRSNEFLLAHVPPGSYLLEVTSLGLAFPPLRVDVAPTGEVQSAMTFRGNEWGNQGERRAIVGEGQGEESGYRIELLPPTPAEMYTAREGFSPLKLLSSPMMLIAAVGLAGVVLVPKLIDNMDPEMRAEFEKEQKNSILGGGAGGAAAAMNPFAGFDAARFLAGATAPAAAAAAVVPEKSAGKRGGGGGGGKRR